MDNFAIRFLFFFMVLLSLIGFAESAGVIRYVPGGVIRVEMVQK